MVCWELKECGRKRLGDKNRTIHVFVHRNTESKSSTTLVNSQLVRLRPVGILNPVKFDLNYLFQSFAGSH